jgi:hypothetical protein
MRVDATDVWQMSALSPFLVVFLADFLSVSDSEELLVVSVISELVSRPSHSFRI